MTSQQASYRCAVHWAAGKVLAFNQFIHLLTKFDLEKVPFLILFSTFQLKGCLSVFTMMFFFSLYQFIYWVYQFIYIG